MAETHTTQYGDHTPDWVPIAWFEHSEVQWRCRICGEIERAPEQPAPIPWNDPSSTPVEDIEAFLNDLWG